MIKHVTVVGLVGAAALVVVLGIQTSTLREQRSAAVRRTVEPYPGMYVPAFAAPVLGADSSVTIARSGAASSQILLVFTTTCPYCLRSLPAWRELTAEANRRSDAPRVIGVSLDSIHETRDYITSHGLSFPVVRFPDRRTRALYRPVSVPQMLVIDRDGRVAYHRIGVIESQMVIDSVLAAAKHAPEVARP